MLNNEKQLKNILKKIINENYRRHLIKEGEGNEDDQDAGVEDENIIQSTAPDAGVESTQDARTDTDSNNDQNSDTATNQGNEITFRFVQTGKNNKNQSLLNLNPGQMKIQFKSKKATQISNISGPIMPVSIPQSSNTEMINTTDISKGLEQAKKEVNKGK